LIELQLGSYNTSYIERKKYISAKAEESKIIQVKNMITENLTTNALQSSETFKRVDVERQN